MPRIDQKQQTKVISPNKMYTVSDFMRLDEELGVSEGYKNIYELAVLRGIMKKVPEGFGFTYHIVGNNDGFDVNFDKFKEVENLWAQYEKWKMKQEYAQKKQDEAYTQGEEIEALAKNMSV